MADLIKKSPSGKYIENLNYCFEVRFGSLVFSPEFIGFKPERKIDYVLDAFFWDDNESLLAIVEYTEEKTLALLVVELLSGKTSRVIENDGLIKVDGFSKDGTLEYRVKSSGAYMEKNYRF